MPIQVEEERESLQRRIADWLDLPLAILALIWVGLLVIELVWPLPSEISERILQVDLAIWLIFVADFAFEFALAPNKRRYLRSNVLVTISLVLPFVRIARVVRFARLFRSVSLVRLTLIANRASLAISEIFKQHGFQYLIALTAIVTLLGAAGVFYFERGVPGTAFRGFGDALWWAATMVTTINIGADPITLEGRIIAVLLRVFAMAVFGYIAASIASYLIGRREGDQEERRSEREAIDRLAQEVDRLRAALDKLQGQSPDSRGPKES